MNLITYYSVWHSWALPKHLLGSKALFEVQCFLFYSNPQYYLLLLSPPLPTTLQREVRKVDGATVDARVAGSGPITECLRMMISHV